jgi:hypothetical protein
MQLFSLLFTVLGLLSVSVNAFGFFDQMFGQQQQQQQQQQNVRSDSSWYQAQYENGMLPALSPKLTTLYHPYMLPTFSTNFLLLHHAPQKGQQRDINSRLTVEQQHTVQITSAPEPSPAYISLITAPAHGRQSKIKRNLGMALPFVRPRVDTRRARLPRRLNWRGRDCYEKVESVRKGVHDLELVKARLDVHE